MNFAIVGATTIFNQIKYYRAKFYFRPIDVSFEMGHVAPNYLWARPIIIVLDLWAIVSDGRLPVTGIVVLIQLGGNGGASRRRFPLVSFESGL